MRETLCLIAGAKNEAKALPRFFEHHAWVDEILVMDSFSTDATREICRRYGRRCHQAELGGDANARLTLAASLCASDWMLLIDPDEFISDGLKRDIVSRLSSPDPGYAAYEFPRVNYFLGEPLSHGGWSGHALKMFRPRCVAFEGNEYHERPVVQGRIGRLSGEVRHYPSPNIHWMLQKFNYISEFDLQGYYNKFGELSERRFRWLLFTRPLKNFWKCYVKKQGYRDGLHGLVYAALIWAFDVIRICKYGERHLIKNPSTLPVEELPDPWACRK